MRTWSESPAESCHLLWCALGYPTLPSQGRVKGTCHSVGLLHPAFASLSICSLSSASLSYRCDIGYAAAQAVKGNLALVKGRLRPFRSVSLRLSTGDETVVAPALKRLSSQFEGSVGIGSYPVSFCCLIRRAALLACVLLHLAT